MRRFVILMGGWGLVVAGLVLSFVPVPIPLFGIVPLLLGCAILTSNSKPFRRRMQALRHRFAFLSRWLEEHLHRAPQMIAEMIRRTRPLALHRRARMRSRRG